MVETVCDSIIILYDNRKEKLTMTKQICMAEEGSIISSMNRRKHINN